MVMAFGINIPLYEILLVFIVLLTAGLVFILIELKKLNEYLVVERNDLQRLERDLNMLEDEERKLSADEQRMGIGGRSQPQTQGPEQPQQPRM